MFDPSRRKLIKAAALLPLASSFARLAAAAQSLPGTPAQATFALQPEQPGRLVSDTLTGFSYETLQLANPAFFSADNHALIQLFRQLSPHGVLRIGGNTSDYTVWSEYRGTLPVQQAGKIGPKSTFVLHPQSLHALAGFLRATGWKLVFGVNLKIGVPAMAVELSRAVQQIVGDSLLAVQIGNEANNYEKDYAAFDAAWVPYAAAIRAAGVPIAGPDTGANTDWVIDYAKRHGTENVFLSRHYYRDAASNGSIPNLLAADTDFYAEVDQIMSVADGTHLPFRLSEANSYYFGGRDGVSNVFASALWGADFMLALAQRGVAGINFHGGTLESVEASLGHGVDAATTAADTSARRDAVTSRYSAIAGNAELGFQPRPLYYGMLLAQQFAGAQMLPGRLDAAGVNLTAYAALRDGAVQVALINKDPTRDASVAISGLKGFDAGKLMRLSAPSLDSRHGIVLEGIDGTAAGHSINADAHGICHVVLPRSSAAWVRWNHSV
ncbi:glycosyl hydrolase family 79 C-terminal domain-containing protein [Dyella caseinilytica]|uniref:Glycosyl hydrolase family 79 n=1 Tax=Dyella caseinilytica TaxID=1849581 RepID=A0ABX7GWQ5_9GAMM|nr:glycosyl hydrolase family 79 C-terminal domain-containing protein [Dyella caseinilytica]QRN54889.1 hypothetical protein ISN74_05930 [Dyella caseinilytica]GFZ97702.1 hypothetical protein GCM10011408_17750 [Dyella caseinilytica]